MKSDTSGNNNTIGIELNLPKGKKDEIKAHAEKYQNESGKLGLAGYSPKGSITGFINRAIDETMDRDTNTNIPNTEPTKPATGDPHVHLTDEEKAHIKKRREVLAKWEEIPALNNEVAEYTKISS